MSDVEDEWHDSVVPGGNNPGPVYDPHGPLRRVRWLMVAFLLLLIAALLLGTFAFNLVTIYALGFLVAAVPILWIVDLVAVWI